MTNDMWTEPNSGDTSATPSDPFTKPATPGPATPGPAGPGPTAGPTVGAPAGPTVLPGASFFDSVRRTGVVRPERGRWFAGVCAGIARRTGMAPGVVRLLAVIASMLGVGGLLYGLAWFFFPQEDGRIHAQEILMGRVTAGAIGAIIVTLMGLGDAPASVFLPYHHGGWLWIVLVIVAVVLIGKNRRSQVNH